MAKDKQQDDPIARWMREHSKRVAELASAADVNPTTLRGVLAGHFELRRNDARRLAKVTNLPASLILISYEIPRRVIKRRGKKTTSNPTSPK